MKIVIDIPDEDIYAIKYLQKNGYASRHELAILDGIPLPKGHGILIDADELVKQLEAMANIEWNQQVGSSKGLEDAIDIVDDAPTIIEADKEVQMKKDNPNLTIPEALSGACFHGEVWVKCPHCMSGNQIMGKEKLYKQDGYFIYKCDECGKLFKDR